MILPLDQQVAPLELCRRLKELGAPQESAFAWHRSSAFTEAPLWRPLREAEARTLPQTDRVPDCAAYTVAELLALLPASETFRHPCGHRFAGEAARVAAALLVALAERGVVGSWVYDTPINVLSGDEIHYDFDRMVAVVTRADGKVEEVPMRWEEAASAQPDSVDTRREGQARDVAGPSALPPPPGPPPHPPRRTD